MPLDIFSDSRTDVVSPRHFESAMIEALNAVSCPIAQVASTNSR
jgi:hypothetical protein